MNLEDELDSFVCGDDQPKNNVGLHLEMMIHKRERCREWVSLQLPKKKSTNDGDKEDEIEDISDSELNNTDIDYVNQDSGRRSKIISKEKISLKLKCEWKGCRFQNTNNLREFSVHIFSHIAEVRIHFEDNDDEMCTCLWESCFFETANEREMVRHLYYHAYHANLKAAAIRINHLWKFSFCKLDEDTRNCLPDLPTSFSCEWLDCDFTNDDFQRFITHVNTHSYECSDSDKKQLHTCQWKGCMSTFTKVTCKVHLRKHSNEKLVACPTCGVMFSTNTKYKEHCIRRTPAKIENNRCKYCWRYYASVQLLKNHMRYHINQYKCCFCEMTCPTPARLASHVQYCHLNERHFSCLICSFSTKTIDDYNSHLIVHDPDHRTSCKMDKCGYSCKRKYALKRHYVTAHGGKQSQINYVCHLCDKVYTRGYNLTCHLQKFHNIEKPAGHSRFRYMQNLDGNWQLQTERYESIEPQNGLQSTELKIDELNSTDYIVKPLELSDKKCYSLTVLKCNKEQHIVDNSENETSDQNGGKLITLEELDESGSIIRSQLVRENTLHELIV